MDPERNRTLFAGLIAAFVIYGLGLAMSALVGGRTGMMAGNVLILVSLVFAVAWAIAVRRGFRLGATSRAGRRRKDRTKKR